MPQEATKTEYAIAIAGLVYITAFTTAEQMAELGKHAYRRVGSLLGESADADVPVRPARKATERR